MIENLSPSSIGARIDSSATMGPFQLVNHLHVPIAVTYYAIALMYRMWKPLPRNFLHTPPKNWLSVFVILFLIISYILEAIFFLLGVSNEREWWAPKHDLVHVMESILTWGCPRLTSHDVNKSSRHPFLGLCTVSCFFEVIHAVLEVLP